MNMRKIPLIFIIAIILIGCNNKKERFDNREIIKPDRTVISGNIIKNQSDINYEVASLFFDDAILNERFRFSKEIDSSGFFFCPSCAEKRTLIWGAWVKENVLKNVSHRQWVFTIPKVLRMLFYKDRLLLAGLARCAAATILSCTRPYFRITIFVRALSHRPRHSAIC